MNPDPTATEEAEYPDHDGQPMADNTLQWDWIVKIVGELREQFAGKEVFVAGDLLWYPVRGEPKVCHAPDVLVAFDRPAGYRGSYKQWEEAGVAPHVVMEVLSPGNTREEMATKLKFYTRHGVEEYYLIDPYKNRVYGWVRGDGEFQSVVPMNEYISPRLGIRFEENGELKLFTADGREFCTREERIEEIQEELRKTALAFEDERERAINALDRLAAEKERTALELHRAEEERRRAEAEHQRAETEREAKEILAAKLRSLGIDPATVLKPAG